MKCPSCNTDIIHVGTSFCPSCGTRLAAPVQAPSVLRHAKPPFDYARDFSEGLAMVSKGYQAGYIDATGKLAIPMKYYYVPSSSEARCVHSMMDKGLEPWVLLNRAPEFSEEFASVMVLENKCLKNGFINCLGEWVIGPSQKGYGSFSEGLAAFYENGKIGFVDAKGRVAIRPAYSSASHFSSGFAVVADGDRYGCRISFIDRSGRDMIGYSDFLQKVHLEHIFGFQEGLSLVILKRSRFDDEAEYGFIDGRGTFLTSYGKALSNFSEGRALIQDWEGHTGFIDSTMDVVIEPRFSWASPFHEGKAAACDASTGRTGFIDRNGQMLFTKRFDSAGPFREGMAAIMVNRKIGFVNAAGEMTVPPQFDDAGVFSCGWAAVKKNGQWNYIDKNGHYMF